MPTLTQKFWLPLAILCLAWGLPVVQGAVVFPPPPTPQEQQPKVPHQFDMTGYIQEATVDPTLCPTLAPELQGGHVTLNNITVTVPCNTILQLPANTLTWAQLISPPPTGFAPPNTPAGGLVGYEIHVQGNILNTPLPPGVASPYIAGLIFVSFELLNGGAGIITHIDYTTGELSVQGIGGAPDAFVRINDPIGRHGLVHGPGAPPTGTFEDTFDPRFTPDTANPTIRSITGYPMCIPRHDPFKPMAQGGLGDDPLCPQGNRPKAPCKFPVGFTPAAAPIAGQYCKTFQMDPPPKPPVPHTGCAQAPCPTDATQQAPFEIGDFIAFQGTMKSDSRDGHHFIAAHTITAQLGIFTSPGVRPAYVAIEGTLVGTTADTAVAGVIIIEPTNKFFKVIGFTTDPSALVDVFAQDADPRTGVLTDRLIATLQPDPVAAGPLGRFRLLNPPPTIFNRGALVRNYKVTTRTACGNNNRPCLIPNPPGVPPQCPNGDALCANGLVDGLYSAPNFEFIFPETRQPGEPIVPANFQDMPFLFCGSGRLDPTDSKSPVAGPLTPAPWQIPPQSAPVSHCP